MSTIHNHSVNSVTVTSLNETEKKVHCRRKMLLLTDLLSWLSQIKNTHTHTDKFWTSLSELCISKSVHMKMDI